MTSASRSRPAAFPSAALRVPSGMLVAGFLFLLGGCGGSDASEADLAFGEAGAPDASGQAANEAGRGADDLTTWDGWGDIGHILGSSSRDHLAVFQVVAEARGYLGRDLLLEGTASRVCLHQGCWLSVDAGDDAVDVRIDVAKDEDDVYRFTVPPDLVGRRVVVHGTLMRDEMLEEDELEEGGPERRLRIVATSVLAEPTANEEAPEA